MEPSCLEMNVLGFLSCERVTHSFPLLWGCEDLYHEALHGIRQLYIPCDQTTNQKLEEADKGKV